VRYRFDKERLIEEFLMSIRTNIIDAYGERLVSIVLFGSVSRKRYTKGSDIDILIVAKTWITPLVRESIHSSIR
jgi:predicted nucleotidyltransferase